MTYAADDDDDDIPPLVDARGINEAVAFLEAATRPWPESVRLDPRLLWAAAPHLDPRVLPVLVNVLDARGITLGRDGPTYVISRRRR